MGTVGTRRHTVVSRDIVSANFFDEETAADGRLLQIDSTTLHHHNLNGSKRAQLNASSFGNVSRSSWSLESGVAGLPRPSRKPRSTSPLSDWSLSSAGTRDFTLDDPDVISLPVRHIANPLALRDVAGVYLPIHVRDRDSCEIAFSLWRRDIAPLHGEKSSSHLSVPLPFAAD